MGGGSDDPYPWRRLMADPRKPYCGFEVYVPHRKEMMLARSVGAFMSFFVCWRLYDTGLYDLGFKTVIIDDPPGDHH
ncbi:hypothetical protein NDN08_000771 [Rhodosorus marinus]|uniref:Uncharacterized protein n=1 Tax=Rhodosorus marinus TaxID=101924 RepID=A0AAV8USI9_9RHOD|nr:hypothetical protein NDN08_000771 [Rhodosorus marinus]